LHTPHTLPAPPTSRHSYNYTPMDGVLAVVLPLVAVLALQLASVAVAVAAARKVRPMRPTVVQHECC